MTKLFAAAALFIALAAPAIAADSANKRSFTRDGHTYVYTVTEKSGRTHIDGRRYPSGRAFQLTVRDGRVSGVSGGVPVAFTVSHAQRAQQLASR